MTDNKNTIEQAARLRALTAKAIRTGQTGAAVLFAERADALEKGQKEKRFVVMSVPTNDGAFWFCYDKQTNKSIECDSREAAAEVCRLSNSEGETR